MCQGIGQCLDRAYQVFLPSQLFLSDLKPLLVQPKVCAPQLIHLACDFHALTFPACAPVKFDEGVKQCALDVNYVHAGAANLSIIQAPLRDLHETSIQSVPKPDLECLTSKIPSCSMLICPGFDLDVESMQQAPDLALIHAKSEESWIIMSAPALDTSFECNNLSLLTGVKSGPLAKNSVSYSILSDKTVVFIQSSPLSQREHINYVLGIPLSTSIWGNGV